MALIVKPLVMPSSLVGAPNGNLPSTLLVSVHEKGLLHSLTARAWKALVADAAANGLPLTFTYGGMYRSYESQFSLFFRRYTQCSYLTYTLTSSSKRKKWVRNGSNTYWKLNPGMAMAAVPGTSNHGLGLAIDTAFDNDLTDGVGPDDATGISSHPKFALFRDVLVPKYGFSFEAQSEPWHIRYIAGDKLPVAVLLFEGNNSQPTPQKPPTPPRSGVNYVQPTIKLGSAGADVYALQAVLRTKGGQSIVVDGDFGPATDKALRNLQIFFGLTNDGVCGPKGWALVNTLINL